jgi:signal transduction histidine kinase
MRSERLWRRAFNTDPETGVLVRVLVTVMLAVALLTSRAVPGWLLAVHGGAFACWLFWAVFDSRLRRASLVALAMCSIIAASAIGTGNEGTVVMACLALPAFASHLRPPTWVITALTLLDLGIVVASTAAWGMSASETLGLGGLMVVLTLFGLHRRQYRLQARQTELLLEQTQRAQKQQAKAAALDERARIAREMHDVLAHSLGALSVQLEVAEALLSEKDDPVRALERVRRSRRLAVEGLEEARRAVSALRSDVPPLPEALAYLVEAYRHDHHSAVDLHTVGEPRPVSAPATVSLLAAAREALTNAAKHAPDVPVEVVLDYRTDAVSLHVTNAAEPAGAAGGYGLAGMRERIALVGGTLTAGHGAAGWRVVAEVPE